MNDKKSIEGIKMAQRMIIMMGFAFLAIGIYCLLQPQIIMDFLGFKNDMAKIFSSILIFIGCMDIFVLPKIMTMKLNKKK